MDEIVYLLASVGVFIAEGVKDDTAVYVHVFAEGVVLEGIAGVDDWRCHVFLLLPCLLLEESLIVLEVFERRLDPEVDFVLEQFNHLAMQRHVLCPLPIPLL
jgi:hypothetical protein